MASSNRVDRVTKKEEKASSYYNQSLDYCTAVYFSARVHIERAIDFDTDDCVISHRVEKVPTNEENQGKIERHHIAAKIQWKSIHFHHRQRLFPLFGRFFAFYFYQTVSNISVVCSSASIFFLNIFILLPRTEWRPLQHFNDIPLPTKIVRIDFIYKQIVAQSKHANLVFFSHRFQWQNVISMDFSRNFDWLLDIQRIHISSVFSPSQSNNYYSNQKLFH